MDRSACHDSKQHASDRYGGNDAHRPLGTDHAPLVTAASALPRPPRLASITEMSFVMVPSLGLAHLPLVRHRSGCVWSLLIKSPIVRCGQNLLTALRVPGELVDISASTIVTGARGRQLKPQLERSREAGTRE